MRVLLLVSLLLPIALQAFVVPASHRSASTSNSGSVVWSSKNEDKDEKAEAEELLKDAEATLNLKASAEQMKQMKPQDVDAMIRELENLPEAEKKQLESMGMSLSVMKESLQMMKSNPNMAKEMALMLETLSPQEIMQKSKSVQQEIMKQQQSSNTQTIQDEHEDEDEEDAPLLPDPDPELLDAMFRVGELMSSPPTTGGGVTFAAFATLPPIALLVGNDPERDLSPRELKECWADGSLGSTRVDRTGFARVWKEVQDYFTMEIMDKARERSLKKKRGGEPPSAPSGKISPTSTTTTTKPLVGDTISPDLLQQEVSKMSDQDLTTMLDQMKSMTPEQQARMEAMGVDPTMVQKTASMLQNNPLMMQAAKTMMKTMTPEQMKQASQKAQEQMNSMTPEQRQQLMDQLEQQMKKGGAK